eukprot:EG_transcript_23051
MLFPYAPYNYNTRALAGVFQPRESPLPLPLGPVFVTVPLQPGMMRANDLERVLIHQNENAEYTPAMTPERSEASEEARHPSEDQIVDAIVSILNDPKHNAYQASVPIERVQNVCRSRFPQLYEEVVGMKHNSWRHFLERHPDKFAVFSIDDGKLRMRWLQHVNWQIGDDLERADRSHREDHIAKCIVGHLRRTGQRHCTVDAFIEVYPALEENLALQQAGQPGVPLPARGDLVRFVKRHPKLFEYDSVNLRIMLRGAHHAPGL